MSLLKKLFGGTSVDFATLVKQGAMIIDVRSPAEFKGGHVKGAVNMPLQSLQANMSNQVMMIRGQSCLWVNTSSQGTSMAAVTLL